jgi:hypothetical protein
VKSQIRARGVLNVVGAPTKHPTSRQDQQQISADKFVQFLIGLENSRAMTTYRTCFAVMAIVLFALASTSSAQQPIPADPIQWQLLL